MVLVVPLGLLGNAVGVLPGARKPSNSASFVNHPPPPRWSAATCRRFKHTDMSAHSIPCSAAPLGGRAILLPAPNLTYAQAPSLSLIRA